MAYVIETQLLATDIATKVIHGLNKSLQSLGAASSKAGKQAQSSGMGFGKMTGAMTLGSLAAQGLTLALRKLKDGFIKTMFHVARVEEMRIVLQQVGKTAGYSAGTMKYFTNVMKKLGIETDVAQAGLVRIIQAQLNLTDAMKLARVAQDAAVVSGLNSSEALERMIHGIVTLRPIVLRQLGIMVSLESEYARFTEETGRTVESLSEQEKQQLALNAVLREGEKLQGAYEAAMKSASKQLRSTSRYTKELMESMTKLAAPMFEEFVLGLNDAIKDLTHWMENNQEALAAFGKGLGMAVKWTFEFVRALEQVLYWLALSPRAWAEMAEGWERYKRSLSIIVRWLGGTSQETLKAEEAARKYKNTLDENRESINSLLAAEDLNLRADILNLQYQYKQGLIDEIKFKEELEKLTKKLALSEALLAEKKKQARIAEEKRQRDIRAMRKKLDKEIMKMSMEEAEFAKAQYKKQADEYLKLVGTTEEYAEDRKNIEKWLQMHLAKIEEQGAERRMSIIQNMRETIARLTQGAAAEQKMQLQRELDEAEKAGVDRVLIEQYKNERLAEIQRQLPSREEFEVQLGAEIQTEEQMAILNQQHLERREAINKHYDELLEQARQFEDAKEQIARVGAARERALQAEQSAYLQAQARMRTETILEGVQTMNAGLEALYSSGLAKNKAVFYAMKAASISEAIINAHLAATKALAQLGPIGGPVMAGIIYASSMMRVAAIAAQQPGYERGGIVYPRGAEGQSVRVAEKGPEAIIPLYQGRVPVQMLGGQQAPVMNVTIQAIDTQSGMDFLMKNKSTIGNAMLGAQADNHPIRRGR